MPNSVDGNDIFSRSIDMKIKLAEVEGCENKGQVYEQKWPSYLQPALLPIFNSLTNAIKKRFITVHGMGGIVTICENYV
jgi:hypothetical protein